MKKLLLLIPIIILAALVVFWLYPTPKPDLTKYSNPDYAKYVELQAYLMTPDQVADLFASNPDGIPSHWTVQDTSKQNTNSSIAKYTSYLEPLYLVIRMKNTGPRYAWGELICELPAGGNTEIQVLYLRPSNKRFQNFVRRIYSGGIFLEDLKVENPQLKWKQIYTKPSESD